MLKAMIDEIALLQELVAIPAPPGQETALADLVASKVAELGLTSTRDAKGNVLVRLGPPEGQPAIVVTAHLDELALMVTRIESNGDLRVTPLGGVQPWKWGEGPVEVLSRTPVAGILSFGSVHTEDKSAVVVQAKNDALEWEQTRIVTGLTPAALAESGVRPGSRAVVARSRRTLTRLGDLVSGYFLDDRSDIAAWLLVLERLKSHPFSVPVLFAATASEEVGGEGALYILNECRPPICLALELGPIVPDTPATLSASPTVWAKDSYAAMDSRDLELIADLGHEVQWQVLSRGGSDASCAASHGLCARPITFGIPMENTHGYEIIHRDAIKRLADLSIAYLTEAPKTL